MDILYLIPSFVAAIFLFTIAVYLIFLKPKKSYIMPLILIAFASLLWNLGIILTNLSEDKIIWAEISAAGLILLPTTIFHFSCEYTKFFSTKWYLIAYSPVIALSILLAADEYVIGVTYLGFGYEPTYDLLLFSINSWLGFFLLIFSTFMLFRYYRENVGIKRRQSLYILIAVPANALLSFSSYAIMRDFLNIAQFPAGAIFDFIMFSIILYAILRFKLPVETAAEIDFRILAETANEGIIIVDEKGCIDYANQHFFQILKLTNKNVTGKKFEDFLKEESKSNFYKCQNRTLEGKKVYNLELKMRANSTSVTVEINTAPIRWNDNIIGCFVTIRDIDERKKMQDDLEKQREYFKALFDGSPEAIVSLDVNNLVLDINPEFENLFGYTVKELIGKNIDDYILPEEESNKGLYISERVKQGSIVRTEGYRKRKNGVLCYVSILGAPIFVGGIQIGIYGIYRDITEQKVIEQEREFLNSLLRHDISNKNTVIQGNLELLEEAELTDEERLMLEDALIASRSSSELIEKIRDLHKANQKGELVLIDLYSIITKVVGELQQQAKNKGIIIKYIPIKAVVKANTLIENIFLNLIQNAILHAECSTINIFGTTEKTASGVFYKITIEDDGIGIPEELIKNIFTPRIKRRGSPGSGLGLSLVKKLVENYYGRIEVNVKKSPKHGTVFDIYLPKAI